MSHETAATEGQLPAATRKSSLVHRVVLIVLGLLLLVGGGVLLWQLDKHLQERKWLQANAAFADGEFAIAEKLSLELLGRNDSNNAARALAVRSAVADGHAATAKEEFQKLASDGQIAVSVALCETAKRHLDEKRLSQSEHYLRGVLLLDPQHRLANERLAGLLRKTGRDEEAGPYELQLLELGRVTFELLAARARGEAIAPSELTIQWLEDCHSASPDDPLPLLGLSRAALLKNDPEQAQQLAKEAMQLDQENVWAHALLGLALVKQERTDKLPRWNSELPAGADELPVVWLVRGYWAQHDADWSGAARCFGEVLRRDAFLSAANAQLPEVLEKAGNDQLAALAAGRNELLDDLVGLLADFQANPQHMDTVVQISKWMATAGRPVEAISWSRLAAVIDLRHPVVADASSLGDSKPAEEAFAKLLEGVNRHPLPRFGKSTSVP